MSFTKYNKIFGFICGLIAFLVYSLTVEPTASYWDCAEYISTSAKLQIGHPPGAPLFQMLGAIFSILAFDLEQIAFTVNMMSVTSSAFTIVFLFWSISLITKKILGLSDVIEKNEIIKVFGSSFLGALTFTFTDSFWFNAVEAEVYAMATLILSILFWLGLKWESEFDTERSDRWLILISFVIGLSFGVHFMGLLALPSIGLIYYFKKYSKFDFKKFVLANIISVSILLFIFKLLLPSTLKLFGYLEVFFVNELGLPFNSGTIFTGFLLVFLLYSSIKYTHKRKLYNLNTLILCLTFIFIGFSSWLMIPIRSNAETVINENSPKDARSLLAYYNLEQYPDTYLFYGPMFTDAYAGQDEDEPYKDDKPKYEKDERLNRYVIVNDWERGKINSNKKHRGLFPRMWSSDNAVNYLKYYGFLDFEIKKEYKNEPQIQEIVQNFRNEIDNLLANMKSNEENYSKLITKSDKQLSDQKYDDAIANYKEALKIKPDEQYPKDQILKAEEEKKAAEAAGVAAEVAGNVDVDVPGAEDTALGQRLQANEAKRREGSQGFIKALAEKPKKLDEK